MSTATKTIDHAALTQLIEAGAIEGADVIGQAGGWAVVVRFGMSERALAARRGAVRIFRKFETLVAYLKALGISQFNVNATDFDQDALKTRRARPDASERMRSAFEAKAHTDWVRAKVADSLADPQPNRAHAQVMAEAQALIDAKRRQHASKTPT